MLHDSVKARREVDLHWRVSGCRHIVNVIDVYENKYNETKCLLVVMEWYKFGVRFIYKMSLFVCVLVWKEASSSKGFKTVKTVLSLNEV